MKWGLLKRFGVFAFHDRKPLLRGIGYLLQLDERHCVRMCRPTKMQVDLT